MSYDGTKLVYSDGKPQWLMPDGSFVPARHAKDGSIVSSCVYLRDKTDGATRLICG